MQLWPLPTLERLLELASFLGGFGDLCFRVLDPFPELSLERSQNLVALSRLLLALLKVTQPKRGIDADKNEQKLSEPATDFGITKLFHPGYGQKNNGRRRTVKPSIGRAVEAMGLLRVRLRLQCRAQGPDDSPSATDILLAGKPADPSAAPDRNGATCHANSAKMERAKCRMRADTSSVLNKQVIISWHYETGARLLLIAGAVEALRLVAVRWLHPETSPAHTDCRPLLLAGGVPPSVESAAPLRPSHNPITSVGSENGLWLRNLILFSSS